MISRSPQRVCDSCFDILLPLQKELRKTISNSTKFNIIDPSTPRRFFNSPVAFTLGHEIRKAGYTLNNFLPRTGRLGNIDTSYATANNYDLHRNGWGGSSSSSFAGGVFQDCKDSCQSGNVNLADFDGVRIPAKLLEQAKGIAVMTVARAGCWVGGEVGTGLVISRITEKEVVEGTTQTQNKPTGYGWSAPSAIGMFGFSVGPLIGAQLVDHVFLLMTDRAVEVSQVKAKPRAKLRARARARARA